MRVVALVVAAVVMTAPAAFAQAEPVASEAVMVAPVEDEATTPAPEETALPEPAEGEALATASAPSAERVCRSGPRSESRLRSRQQICRTQAEWDALDRARNRTGAN